MSDGKEDADPPELTVSESHTPNNNFSCSGKLMGKLPINQHGMDTLWSLAIEFCWKVILRGLHVVCSVTLG